ncbi:MAG TPA: N-formylglutamate amidohydrolase, partial [Rhodobacteraceae bacterium]|nr:N-formylglutamate amidohydrolase [Paracoccaceae bacterium]
AVAQKMSNLLDARLVASTVSRLVYDCNRPPQAPGAMPARSEIHDVPGNTNLTDIEKTERISKVYNPFRNMVSDTLTASAKPPVLVTIHSFTPVYMGQKRTVDIGILHDDDSRLADAMLALAPDRTGLNIRRNDPYGPEDGVTHTLKLHALPRGLLNVMIEIRNDLIAGPASQQAMAAFMADLLNDALTETKTKSKPEEQCRA